MYHETGSIQMRRTGLVGNSWLIGGDINRNGDHEKISHMPTNYGGPSL